MKDVLIYGALVAAVLAASAPMITQFVDASTKQAGDINQQVTDQGEGLVTAIKAAGGSGSTL